MRDGIVTDFYWIIPGDRREFGKSARNLQIIMKSLVVKDPLETRKVTREKGMVKAKIYGRNFIFTTLEDLPEDIDDALLDIDTDYLTTDTVRKANASHDAGKRFPWIWPEELVERIKEKRICPSCVTVAYSVNGGFTPLIYKFLGDETAAFLAGGINDGLKNVLSAKNGALKLFRKGRTKKAIAELEKTGRDLEALDIGASLKNKLKAHIAFLLFRCFVKTGDPAKARYYYSKAVLADKTYRVKDNNYSPMHLRNKRSMKKAEREFKAVLACDKNNTHALSGLANIYIRQRNARRAKTLFKKAYAADRKNREALFGLGTAELLSKNYKAVLRHLEKYRPGNTPAGAVFSLKAAALEGLGKFDKALNEYRFAHRFGVDLNLYLKLFRLLGKTGTPAGHKQWIESRIDTYKKYRKSMRNPEKTTKKLLNHIDRALRHVEQKNAGHRA